MEAENIRMNMKIEGIKFNVFVQFRCIFARSLRANVALTRRHPLCTLSISTTINAICHVRHSSHSFRGELSTSLHKSSSAQRAPLKPLHLTSTSPPPHHRTARALSFSTVVESYTETFVDNCCSIFESKSARI